MALLRYSLANIQEFYSSDDYMFRRLFSGKPSNEEITQFMNSSFPTKTWIVGLGAIDFNSGIRELFKSNCGINRENPGYWLTSEGTSFEGSLVTEEEIDKTEFTLRDGKWIANPYKQNLNGVPVYTPTGTKNDFGVSMYYFGKTPDVDDFDVVIIFNVCENMDRSKLPPFKK